MERSQHSDLAVGAAAGTDTQLWQQKGLVGRLLSRSSCRRRACLWTVGFHSHLQFVFLFGYAEIEQRASGLLGKPSTTDPLTCISRLVDRSLALCFIFKVSFTNSTKTGFPFYTRQLAF